MDMKRLTKPVSKKKRSELTRSTKGGAERSSKEKEKEISKNTESSKHEVACDDKGVLTMCPVLGGMR